MPEATTSILLPEFRKAAVCSAIDSEVSTAGGSFFLAAARNGSLRAAADSLGATHATVDRHLKALEAGFSVRLFDRSSSGLALTPAGEALVPLAEEAEAAVIAARRRLSGLDREASGTVRVSVPPVLAYELLAPVFAKFADAYPEIDLDISVTDRFEDLARHETDVSVRVAHHVDDNVVGRKIVQYASSIYASQRYIDQHFPSAGPEGEGLTWTGWGQKQPVPEWVKSSPFPKAAIRHASREGVLQLSMLRQGMGMSYMPCFLEPYYPDLVRVPGSNVFLDRSVWLLLHADMRRTTRVRLFVDYLAKELTALRPIFLGPMA